jgi:HK97 family phage prohead protease
MTERKVRHLHFDVRTVNDDGTFEGYGSVFGNVDSYGTVVDKGAFANTLRGRVSKIKLLWQHDDTQPIGIFTDLSEDNIGLRFTGQLNLDVQKGKEAYALLKQGAMDGMSIGFWPIQYSIDNSDPQTPIIHFTEVKLIEISLVTFPANEDAVVTQVKSAFEDLTQEQRAQTLTFINNLRKSLESPVQPPTVEASTGNTELEKPAGEITSQEPQAEQRALALMEQLLEALQQKTSR